ncbi:MAG TPA: HAD-IA family hydrolase [Terracidiphilus sp.]|nr:HAD-IA family hydrolase [Terracidiphilus sp.]
MIRVLRPLPVDSLRLLVFDLDGTLIDSAQDLCNSVNATLVHFGRPPLPDEVIARYIGDGALLLVNRALAHNHPEPFDDEFLARAHQFFLDYYREHNLDYTYAFDGVLDALHALRSLHDSPGATRRSMAVLTNKPVRPARVICEALGLAPFFLNIYGGNSFSTKKPNPEGLFALMQEAGARPEETIMIGDSQVDIQTARNAGAWSIGCTFGLAPETLQAVPPDVLVDSPSEWAAALNPAHMAIQP